LQKKKENYLSLRSVEISRSLKLYPLIDRLKNQSSGMNKERIHKWLKRIGIWGFLFFLIKGLVWLAVLFGLFKACE